MKYISIFLFTTVLAVGPATANAGGKCCKASGAKCSMSAEASKSAEAQSCPTGQCASKAEATNPATGVCPVTGAKASDVNKCPVANCPTGSCNKGNSAMNTETAPPADAVPAVSATPAAAPEAPKDVKVPGCCGHKASATELEAKPASPETMKRAS